MLTDVNYTESNIYNYPAICIPPIGGLTMPTNAPPDDSVTEGTVAHLHINSYGGPNGEQLTAVSMLPIITDQGLAYGGQIAAYGARVLPKIQLEGYIETPCTEITVPGDIYNHYIPQPIDSNGIRYMYSEILAMMFEGRTNQLGDGSWARLDPLWYRDPWGRVYSNPRILDMTSTYVVAVPVRTQFTMTLKL